MDSPTSSGQQSFYRKIKQRPTMQQPIRVQNHNSNHEYRSRSWFSSSNSKSTKDSNIEQQPTVKILAKSSKTATLNNNQENYINDSPLKTAVLAKPRPSMAILEKNIQAALNLSPLTHVKNIVDKRRESLPKCIKLVDFEFNFIQQETSTIDSILMSDPGGALATNVASNSPNNASPFTQTPSTISNQTTNSNFGGQSFCIVAAVGMDGTGKSSLLNTIAQCDVFKTRVSMAEKNRENPLSHVTNGIDLHITSERVFLLDTQPLLSASVLDELIRINTERLPTGSSGITGSKHFYNSLMSTPIFSSVVGFDIAETENFAFIYSLQLLTFLITICDHVILVIDSLTLDAHLFKLLATAMMMVGDAVMSKANLIIYLKTTSKKNNTGHIYSTNKHRNFGDYNEPRLESLFKQAISTVLGPTVNVDFINNDESLLTTTVLRPPHSRSLINDQSCSAINYQSERLWFYSVQRFWDSSIRKSSLFSDYARYLP